MMENQTPTAPMSDVSETKIFQSSTEGNKPRSNNPLIALLSVLLLTSVLIAGFFAYQTQKLVKELSVVRTNVEVVEASPEPATSPITIATDKPSVSSPNPTMNWKTFTNSDFTYKFPDTWSIGQGGQALVADTAGAGATNFSKDMVMYNECMKLDKTDIVGDKMVKYYSYIYSGESCSNKADLGNYEAWITKAGGDGFQPGIIYMYNTTSYPTSFTIFQQILSTFKFVN